jgi:hypothetical protein
MENTIIYLFLSSFFELFNATMSKYNIYGKKVLGNIEWKDDNETQDFSWIVELEESALNKLKLLCEFLIDYNLTIGDKIIISESELQKRLIGLGWDISESQKNIDNLLSVEIKMVDDGEETDSFFIHF